VRWFGGAILAGLAVGGPLGAPAHAQFARTRITTVPFNFQQAVNPNYWPTPYMSLRQWSFNTRVVGNAMSQVPPWLYGYNPYPNPMVNFGPVFPSYGYPDYGASLLAGGYGGGGYGASLATGGYPSAGYGGLGGGGYGGGGYWNTSINPYNGYLTGSADLTTANANYQKIIQEARLLREQANRSYLDTRRKQIEEAEYERNEWFKRYDPNEVMKRDQASELDRARHDPPLVDVLSARALNTLLTHLAKQQAKGQPGPKILIPDDVLTGVNVSGQDTRANPGLLKSDGRLTWPVPLESAEFADSREHLSKLLADAVNTAKNGNPVPVGKLKDMDAELSRMNNTLLANVSEMSPSQYIEAKRYLNQVEDAVKALKDPKVANYFNQTWVPKGASVAELVKNMAEKGLVFAPATAGDADAYRAMYHLLQAFDAGMGTVASSGGNR
jgi:hypothetical protein